MALIHCNFYSQELFCGTDLNVIVPSPDSGEVSANADLRYFHPGAKFKVLYLLHGAFGDYSDWARLTSIERYAQEKHLVVVMPSAGNSFYQNMLHGGHYLDYFTKELPAFVATLFPVSDKSPPPMLKVSHVSRTFPCSSNALNSMPLGCCFNTVS